MTPTEAELYALTHRGNPGDVGFYTRACARASRVLELGVGYGRLLPALSRVSGQVVGLDRESALLALAQRGLKQLPVAQRGRVSLRRGDMCDFELKEKFERVLLPYNGLYCLLTREAQLACLRCVRRHLAPGGEFVFDVWAADRFHDQTEPSAYRDDDEPILSLCRGARVWDVFETSHWQKRRQRLSVDYTYVARGRAPRVTTRIEQRYTRSQELFAVLQRAGLQAHLSYGGFRGQRFGARSEQLVVRARAWR